MVKVYSVQNLRVRSRNVIFYELITLHSLMPVDPLTQENTMSDISQEVTSADPDAEKIPDSSNSENEEEEDPLLEDWWRNN